MRASNSHGNDKRGLMKFLRERGVPPTAANVERVGKELRKTHAQVERDVAIHKEYERATGAPSTVDERGDVKARIRERVQRELEARERRNR